MPKKFLQIFLGIPRVMFHGYNFHRPIIIIHIGWQYINHSCVLSVLHVVDLHWWNMWPLTQKRTLTVFRWTAKAVGYPLVTRWVPIGGVDESVEGIGKAVGFFSLPVEGVEKSRWEIFSQTVGNVGKSRLVFFPLPVESAEKSRWEKPLGKAVGKIRPT